jgi:peptide/nickel transport system permease protein
VGHYLLRRLAIAVPSLLGISVVLFTVLALAPGDPFSEMALNPNIPPEVQANLRLKFGLDDPIWQCPVRLDLGSLDHFAPGRT